MLLPVMEKQWLAMMTTTSQFANDLDFVGGNSAF